MGDDSQNKKSGRLSEQDVASLSYQESGMQKSAQVQHLVIGRIVAPRGLRGELRLDIETDNPERFGALREVYLGEKRIPFRVLHARLHQGQALLMLDGISSREAAEAWRNTLVYVTMEDAIPLEKGEYYCHQIVGLLAITPEGERLGRVTEVLSTGANDVYVVDTGGGQELLLPAIKQVVIRIDLDAGAMTVCVPDGLH